MAPESPADEAPELNTKRPLTPAVPASTVRIVTDPLLEVDPAPDSMVTSPPVKSELMPEVSARRPPEPLVPLPTVSRIAPPRPDVAAPLPT
jgi:hypothetical protein